MYLVLALVLIGIGNFITALSHCLYMRVIL